MRSDPHRRGKNTRVVACFFFISLVLCFSFFLSFFPSLSLCVCVFMRCVKFLLRETNRLGEDSRCRGGIVNTRGGCSRSRSIQTHRPKALWRFRASTSNSPSGLSRLHTNTQFRDIYHTYAQQDIRVCGVDPFQPPMRQYSNPKALCLLRVSI